MITCASPDPVEFVLKDGRHVTIARLAAADKTALQAFGEQLSARSHELFLPHRYDSATLDKLIQRNATGDDVIYVGKSGETIVAYFFLWFARRRVPLLGIGIADAFQGAGLGRQLMERLIADGRALGAEGIELTTALDNDRAFALYTKCGFQFLRNVENVVGDGKIKVERCMFLAFRPSAQPMTEPHAAPV